jgi:glycosyltransferase involved in cell wall biosynthesis
MPDGRPWPRVSIVTPSYNQAEFIEETIRSVLLQGYPDLEYIIVDGGSNDGSVEIIRKYAPWLAYWVSEPDRGQTHAINKGWTYATGDVLAYINTDDCYREDALAAAVEGFRADPRAAMVYGTAVVVDEVGHQLRTWEAQPFDLKVMLTVGNVVPQAAAFFARDALERAGYLDETWHMIMDYELCIRLGLQFPAVCLAETLARFRDHPQSKTRSRFKATARELIQFAAIFSTEKVSPQELRAIKRAMVSRVYYECAMTYLAIGRQHGSQALKQFAKSILVYPLFALRRPMDTAYILKEVLLSLLARHDTRPIAEC